MANKGFFILTDISGYTELLTKSELDHAQDALQTLFDAQIEQIKHPFVISGFRGDAILMYLPETHYTAPQTVLESLEKLYFVFADTQRQMQFNTTCTCRACKNMSKLDLKMVIHYGEYAIQKLANHEELLGADVIVPHRMLKNRVVEQTGLESYALFSEVAAQALQLSELAYPLVPHTETYEHLGEVKMKVVDLHQAWQREQERQRVFIQPQSAWLTLEHEFPYPPATVWEYLVIPGLLMKFAGYEAVERRDVLGGRMQPGASFHCAHKNFQLVSKVVDWKPFDYHTVHQYVMDDYEVMQTRILTPTETGTRLTFCIGEPSSRATEEFRNTVSASFQSSFEKLNRTISSDLASGTITIAHQH